MSVMCLSVDMSSGAFCAAQLQSPSPGLTPRAAAYVTPTANKTSRPMLKKDDGCFPCRI